MSLVKCKACGGSYQTKGRDGLTYFHACPPLSPADVTAGIAGGTVVLSPVDQARLDAAKAADLVTPVKAGDPTRESLVLGALNVARPGARDENIDLLKARTAADTHKPGAPPIDPTTLQKAPGAGVTVLVPDDPV